MSPLVARAHRLCRHLPGIELAPYYGEPAVKVGDKVIANACREPGALSIWCRPEDRAILLEARPDIHFVTDHFLNWPAVLVRMDVIDDVTLAARLREAWSGRASRQLREALPPAT